MNISFFFWEIECPIRMAYNMTISSIVTYAVKIIINKHINNSRVTCIKLNFAFLKLHFRYVSRITSILSVSQAWIDHQMSTAGFHRRHPLLRSFFTSMWNNGFSSIAIFFTSLFFSVTKHI